MTAFAGRKRTDAAQRRPRSRVIAAAAGIAALAVVVVLAVTAQGYESQEVPRLESAVWVMRDSGQYARVNTDLAEIDTVRTVDDPEAVWQDGSSAVLFAQGNRQRWDLNPASPDDLLSESPAEGTPVTSEPTPAGTRQITSAGPYVAYRTDTGQVSVSTVEKGAGTALVDPFAAVEVEEDEEPPSYTADAIALSPDGLLALYSADEGAVRRFDVREHRFLDDGTAVPEAPDGGDGLAMTVVDGRWALLQASSGELWISGRDQPIELEVGDDAVLQTGAARGDELAVADADGLVTVDLGTGEVERTVEASGVPAAPVVVAGKTYAAWLDTNAGTLWSGGKTVPMIVPEETLESAAIEPVFQANGDRAVLSEISTGLIWTAPDGALIPLEQWAVEDETEQKEGTIVVEDVAEQMPPVAVNDAFGVRSGEQVILPVLLNDHDPNKKDVLTIDPASISGLSDPAFGDISLVANGQSLVIDVRAGSGQASFTYAVTDGAATSTPATVTLTVVDPASNSAPVWCGVEACQQDWPTPQLLPGGSTIVSVLSGWVDPEGDPFVLSDAYETDSSAPVMVVPMADGRVAIRHTDPNATDAVVSVTVVVEDVHGETAEKQLEVQVTGSAALLAAPVALTTRVGELQSIRISDHLSGGSGSYRLVDAVQTAATAQGLQVTPNAAAGTVDVSVAEPGQFVVTYTAQDASTQAEQSAVIRITAVDGSSALSMAPLTAFVREGEDTTVEVLSAVQNTSGRVLMLSDTVSSTPQLNVRAVGNESIRVNGTTEDGEPGVIGKATVTVTDGSGAAVQGTVTVFLAPPSTVTRPIVFPDAITVRAGSLTRISVAANDVAPRGEPLVVLPEVTGSGEAGELVFADGNALRYLAPTTAGTYRLTYSISLERNPSLYDNGAVTVTVVPAGTNRAPTPTTLTGRVLSGQTVSLPVSATGMDSDGDRVVLAGVDQPDKGAGTATISAAGDAIVYRAPANGVAGGQVSFRYSVRDPQGEVGEGTVRIGVLDADVEDSAPITFSDYLRVEAGSRTPVVLDPRSNDLDPAQGELELVDLVPNAPPVKGNPLYDRLDALIDSGTSLKEGRVMLRAGDTAGTNSYFYTVKSTRTGSTSQGLIVITVTDGAVTDQPRVADTVLTARDRGDMAESGIDVVADRVSWPSGDASSLRLSLWGDQPGFSVRGNRIIGAAPEQGGLVPFRLTGTGSGGRDVVGYGFLHIPAFDDMQVQLKPGATPVVVDEDASATFALRDYVDLPASDDIEIGSGQFGVQRAAASCAAKGDAQAEYRAGREAPWSDRCLVPVRLSGQKRWSHVDVPVTVRPAEPQLLLSSISHTIAPGATESVDLYANMASWEGGREGDARSLDYRVTYSGSAFTVTQAGSSLTVEARADARPGIAENVSITVAQYGQPSASVRLVVGAAPPDAPRGATFTRQCVVTSASCSIDVVGVAGEYDPFEGKTGSGLRLMSLGGGARCDVASVSVSNSAAITATWPGGGQAPGGQCVIPFVVSDAQGRTGAGTLTLDLQGFPQPPASVTTVGFTRSTVELEVPLGEAGRAHPGVTGITISQDGSAANASCRPAGAVYRCTVNGLVNGEPHIFMASAVNAIGASAPTSPHTSWAYAVPVVSSVSASPVYRPGGTDRGRGVVALSIAASDDSRAFRIEETGQVIERTGATTTAEITLSPGAQTVTVVPISQFQPPTGGGGNEGGAVRATVTVAGAPFFDPAGTQASPTSNTSVSVTGVAPQANGSAKPLEVMYLAWRSGRADCSPNGDGTLSVSGAEVASSSATLTGLAEYAMYNVKACVSNGYGVAESDPTQVFTFTFVDGPAGDTSYTIAPEAKRTGDRYSYEVQSAPSISAKDGFVPQFYMYGSWRSSFELTPDASPLPVRARSCHATLTIYCSNPVEITARTAPTTVSVQFQQCVPAKKEDVYSVSSAARGSFKPTFTESVVNGVTVVDTTITWEDAFRALKPITHRAPLCTQPPPPDPTDPTDPAG
ncbi:Ig-like domain-containing protein [Microbacterium sp. NPDC089987]|uniref:Ig-like domain-containing protein n=1 Tax=Microbacterium sp. NPDC089987 TaxID=3364202 RepID=UPI00380E0171